MDFAVPKVMGVLNVTPDSFSDGGKYNTLENAIAHALQLVNEGVDIIDIGGESSQPNATPINVEQECDRIIPVIEALHSRVDVPISVDTRHTATMQAALQAGAAMINDVNALQDKGALSLLAKAGVPVCVMHNRRGLVNPQQATDVSHNGTSRVAANSNSADLRASFYENVLTSVYTYLEARIKACLEIGIRHENIIVDPGFGFGKTAFDDMTMLAHLTTFKKLGCPMLIGLSRKSMIGAVLSGRPAKDRLYGSLAGACIALMQGANIIRVHDVRATKDVLAVVQATQNCRQRSEAVHDCYA